MSRRCFIHFLLKLPDYCIRYVPSVLVAVMVRLQTQVGPEGVRWRRDAARPLRPHMETGHRALQQVR